MERELFDLLQNLTPSFRALLNMIFSPEARTGKLRFGTSHELEKV